MRCRVAAWFALPVLLAVSGCSREVAVTPPPHEATAAAVCARVAAALPTTLAGQDRREVTPDTGSTAAWGDPPIVLRCGVPVPAARTPTSLLTTVDDVDWFAEELTAGMLFTTDGRTVNVEVAVPDAYQPATVLVDLGPVLASVDPAGAQG